MAPMAAEKKNLYQILGISRDANSIDVGLAYERRKAEQQRAVPHDPNDEALVRQAYEVLNNPKRRAAYDASLVTAAEKATAAEQAHAPDLMLEGEEPEPKSNLSKMVPLAVGLVVILVIALYFAFRPSHDAAKSAPAPVAEAPKPAPPPPPPKPMGAHQILPGTLLSVGQVLSYEMSGRAVPIGLALAVEPGSMITTCHGIPAGSKFVLRMGAESFSVDLSTTDEALDLCKLQVPGLNVRPLTIATDEAKAGDKIFTLGVNAKGDFALTEGTVKRTLISEGVKLLELSMPIAATGSGGAVLDQYGRLVGIATTPHRHGAGLQVAISSAWISQMRSRSRPQPQ